MESWDSPGNIEDRGYSVMWTQRELWLPMCMGSCESHPPVYQKGVRLFELKSPAAARYQRGRLAFQPAVLMEFSRRSVFCLSNLPVFAIKVQTYEAFSGCEEDGHLQEPGSATWAPEES